jgi:hypothetical protein
VNILHLLQYDKSVYLKEKKAVYYKNCRKRINTHCEQNTELLKVKAGGTQKEE